MAIVLACACCLVSTRAARAGDAQRQDAETLFRDGKRLLNERNYARACPLLEASFKAEPGTGVLLALAICHEGEGKLASAFAAYRDVAKRAVDERRPDRAKVAQERAAAIEPQLSTLAIAQPPVLSRGSGFTISRNGVVVETEAPIPLDGGTYVIEAKADGKRTWTATVELAWARDRKVVAVPVLEDEPAVRPVTAAPAPVHSEPVRPAPIIAPSATADRAPTTKNDHGGLAVASVALGAASLAGFSVAGYYAWRAKEKNDASMGGCDDGDYCDPGGRANRLAALSAADAATIAFVAATVTAAAAVTLWVIDTKKRARRAGPSATIHGGLAFDPTSTRFLFGLSISQ